MPERKVTVTIDPTLQYERQLRYVATQGGWEIYKAVYWGVYVFVLGLLLLTAVPRALPTMESFIGWALVLLSMFVIVYGFVVSLHLKLMRKHA